MVEKSVFLFVLFEANWGENGFKHIMNSNFSYKSLYSILSYEKIFLKIANLQILFMQK
jgi:hypothetical protein